MMSRAPALVLVGLGHLITPVSAKYGTAIVASQQARVLAGLAAFHGDTVCWLRDSQYADGAADPGFHQQISAFINRMKKVAIIDYEVIDERIGSQSSLALTQRLMIEDHIAPHLHSVAISGAWCDGEDGEVDLMSYALSGMGFRARIDAAAARRPSRGMAAWRGLAA